MTTKNTQHQGGSPERMVRRIPIDIKAIMLQSGMRRGKICHSPIFGWVVQNTSGNPDWPDMAGITPPEMLPGETRISIVDGHWCFHAPNDKRSDISPAASVADTKSL